MRYPRNGAARTRQKVEVALRGRLAAVAPAGTEPVHKEWNEPIAGVEHGEVEYAITREQWIAGGR